MKAPFDALDQLCINTIRTLSIDGVQNANSGHPGLPLGAAPMAYVLWQRHLRHDPTDPRWPDRDRFILSPGHGSMLLYSLLHLTGYPLSLEDLKSFRKWKSLTPGHPESFITGGVEATTGPLGQGSANAVGMAIAERALAHYFNRPGHTIVDHRTWALVSDGDLMEGVAAEAASLAGHLKLAKLTFIYDANDISLDGPTSITFTEDVGKRFEAYGWNVLRVEKGDSDLKALDEAMSAAKAETGKPTLIIVRTTIGYGSPNKQGTSEAHGSPLGPDEVKLTKKALGWDPNLSFHVPQEALARFRAAVEQGKALQRDWQRRLEAYGEAHPELMRAWAEAQSGRLPEGWDAELPTWKAGDSLATRVAAGKVLNAIAKKVPSLMGGDADLSVSTNTGLAGLGSFDGQSGAGRNIHFGVREHAMAGIANGMAYHRGVRPFTATFFVFSDYMRPSVRLAAMSGLPVVHAWTHDSVGLGEDGPTHQPVEHLMALRAMPNLVVVRPADANEAAEAWRFAMEHQQGPVGLVLTRQKVPVLDRAKLAPAAGLHKGAYVLADPPSGSARAIIIATGSEVHLALTAHERLLAADVPTRVVSMPSWEIFAAQDAEYQDAVLPRSIEARVSIEAGVTFGWERWVGSKGVSIGVDHYGASAPAEVIYEQFGLTPEHVMEAVRAVLGR